MASLAGRAAAPSAKRQLTGPERVAMLMLALGEQHGSKIWSMLDDDELRQISIVMSTIGTIDAELVENLLLEFVSRMSASGALMGNYDATERLLQQYLPPERVGNIMDEIRGPAGRNMWEKLSNVQEEVLANYLKNEYPQTVAVVLSKIGPDHAARVLAILPEELALDVINRMLRMEAVQKEVLERVEQTLRTEFMSNLSQTRRRDAHEVMAEIFNNFDRQTETRFLTALEEENREAAERIKTLMFTFDDLTKLDTASSQTLMRHVEKDKLAIALKGAAEPVRQFFLSNMSTRAAKMLMDDMAGHGAGAPARSRRGAGASGQSRQGPCGQGRDRHLQEPRRRRADLLRKCNGRSGKISVRCRLRRAAPTASRRSRSPSMRSSSPRRKKPRASAAMQRRSRRQSRGRPPHRRSSRTHRQRTSPKPTPTLMAIETRLECEAVEVAVAVARKLAPALIEREPFAEISALASDCFRQLVASPHIAVRINDALYATAREKLDGIVRARGFEGRLVVLAEPDIAPGDCRIEWADGGINRDTAKADAAIGEAVAGYLRARRDLAGANEHAQEMRE